MVGLMITFNVIFSSIIAFGVVYNSARISLSERSRELATLRVVGFTRAEISFILLGELAVVTLLAVPLGFLIGYALAALVCEAFSSELYRFPLVIASRTYFFSAVTVIAAAGISSLAVRRRLDSTRLLYDRGYYEECVMACRFVLLDSPGAATRRSRMPGSTSPRSTR